MTRSEFAHVTFISAGAGSGKTYRLTEELECALVAGVRPAAGSFGAKRRDWSSVTLPLSTSARRFVPSAPIIRSLSATGLKSTAI